MIRVSFSDKNSILIALNEPKFDFHSYSFRILNEDGDTVLSDNFESSDYVYTLLETIKKENYELFIVIQSPFEQLTVRLKI